MESLTDHDGADIGQKDEKKKSRVWWATKQCEDEEEAKGWRPPEVPRTTYCCWRAHAAPSTGKPHVHVVLYFEHPQHFNTVKKMGLSNIRFLLTKAQKSNARAYCMEDKHKDGTTKNPIDEFREDGEVPKTFEAPVGKGKKADEVYADALSQADADSCLAVIKEGAPRDYVLWHNNIKSTVSQLKRPQKQWKPRFEGFDWKTTAEMNEWVRDELPKEERAKCLILVGPTRLGKTEWARHLFPNEHMYFRGMFNLEKWDISAKLLIFDDISWEFIPQKKSLLTQMGEAEVTDKYVHKKTVYVDMPAIVLSNDLPDFGKEQAYWEENSQIIVISESLF